MTYVVNGVELAADADGYLIEANFSDDVPPVIAGSEGIALTEAHWDVIRFLRSEYQEHGHTPNFRNMVKGMQDLRPEADSKYLYDLFPMGPAKQGAKVAGLPQPYGKGGY
ncbi:MAG: TusE/DsrC/DsvC family sulfur relay protein [Burkholderiales bacterium]